MDAETERLITIGVQRLKGKDCGDNSCHFATKKGGMRTNGGCRCLSGLPDVLRAGLTKLYKETIGDV